MMQYQHVIFVNDAVSVAPGQLLTREQLWDGLVMRAENPLAFLDAADEMTILSRDEYSLVREVRFGSMRVCDRIVFDRANWQITYETEPGDQHQGGRQHVSIDADNQALETLAVRFVYEVYGVPDVTDEDKMCAEYLKQAYKLIDLETIERIRAKMLT